MRPKESERQGLFPEEGQQLHLYDACSQNTKEGPTGGLVALSEGNGLLANSEERTAWVVEGNRCLLSPAILRKKKRKDLLKPMYAFF